MSHPHDPRSCRACRAALQSSELQPQGDWHLCDGPDTKSPLWRCGAWLIGFVTVLAGIAVTSVLTGFGTWRILLTPILWFGLLAGVLLTVPHAIARARGRGIYQPPRDAMKMRPEQLKTVVWNLVVWRSFLAVGDSIATALWNAALPGTPLTPNRGEEPTDSFAHR